MKLYKKVFTAFAISLLTTSGVIYLHNNSLSAYAITKSTIKTSNLERSIPTFNKTGKEIYSSSTKVRPNEILKVLGQPKLINVKNYESKIIIINGESYLFIGNGGYIKVNNLGNFNKNFDQTLGKFKLSKNAYVYNSKGKRLTRYHNHKAYFKAGSVLTYKATHVYSSPESFFQIGNNEYIRADYVSEYNNKGLLGISHNAYIYNSKGERLKNYAGQKNATLKKGSITTYTAKIKNSTNTSPYYFYNNYVTSDQSKTLATKKIKGQDYFLISKNSYIKSANVNMVSGHILFTTKPTYLIINHKTIGYSEKFKKNNIVYHKGQKIKISRTVIDTGLSDPQLYFQVSGKKNQLIYWNDFGEYSDANNVYDLTYQEGESDYYLRAFLLSRN